MEKEFFEVFPNLKIKGGMAELLEEVRFRGYPAI